ncbi:MAG: 4'-phosphopantetheinyl transferase superfamily protein [Candidatus Korobacteraceae bacterium]|jgi:4'-phosphopantetheinyl transferase
MMDVFWLEQAEADLPSQNDWLSASERLRLDGMRFAKRHADWRLGRWTAKRALAAYLHLPSHSRDLAGIEIRSAPSGAPEVFIANQPAGVAISLSHRAGVAACAVTLSGAELGCDLEIVEPRSDAFLADYFVTEEQALIERTSAAERSRLLALLWSGKESALKALRAGLRLDTRSVTVRPVAPALHGDGHAQAPALAALASYGPESWQPLQVVYEGGQIFHGWWQNTGDLLRTMVASPRPAAPIFLEATAHYVQSAS